MEYKENKRFMGTGLKFPFSIDPATNKIAMSSAEDDIKEAVRIILKTNLGERVMLPEFGTPANEFVFSDNRSEQMSALEMLVKESLERWEPRIMDIEVEVSGDIQSKEYIEINISYVVRTTNNQFNMVYPFYMMEGEGK